VSRSAFIEQGVVFSSGENRLVGVAALPASPASIGVLILVGGPQYRTGSHRQFTLLARDLAAAGIASLRFDFTGMGDSEGQQQAFNDIDEDLSAALAAFMALEPKVERVVLWGLCDAASSSMMHAHSHSSVCGMVLLNPWVHGAEFSPAVKLSHYYRPLLTGKDSWRRMLAGEVELLPAFKEFVASSFRTVLGVFGGSAGKSSRHSFVDQMSEGLGKFGHESLIILSEDDLTAHEFTTLTAGDRRWRKLMSNPRISSHTVAEADHTFSTKSWREEVSRLTIDWVKRI
jgi:uncharacterized protein